MSRTQVLVVEDECITARALQEDLTGMGYDVPVVATSGEEAIEQAEATYPDLLLMDIVLKGNMDGIEASRHIRERLSIPVVYLTAYEDDATLKRAQVTEPFGYLLKPYEGRELHTTIEMALYKHRMERKLKEAERWLAATLNSITDAVIATDARHTIRFTNPGAAALTGWDPVEAFGRTFAEVFRPSDGHHPALLEAAAHEAFRRARAIRLPQPLTLLGCGDSQAPVEGSVSAILDDEGLFAGFVWVFRDISERLQAEEARRQHEEQQRHAQQMESIARLAGGVAHDFNNLLTVILGNTSLLLADGHLADRDRDRLSDVQQATERLAGLVERLQCFSGQSNLRLQPANLNDVIPGMLVVLRPMVQPPVAVEFESGPDLWAVQADSAQIFELLLSLSCNARDAMPDGGQLVVQTGNVVLPEGNGLAHPRARAGEFVRLRVRDTGPGIPLEMQARIFEPFFTTRGPGKGTGLGLALVFGIVEQHRGWIECTSVVNQGTCFDIYLPRYGKDVEATPAPGLPRLPAGARRTVLLADDEPLVRQLGEAILHNSGYEVLLATDGVEAVDIYQRESHRIDLVILDLAMPRLSGSDTFRQLVQIDPAVRVFFSSGYFADEVPGEDDRILGCIHKPYHPEELASRVRNALALPSAPVKDRVLLLLNRLERALAGPVAGDWLAEAGEAVAQLEQMLDQHVGDPAVLDGLFAVIDPSRASLVRQMNALRRRCADLLAQAGNVKRSIQETAHRQVAARVGSPMPSEERPVVDLDEIRRQAADFLTALHRHRQQEMKLVFEGVVADIGAAD